MERVTPIGLVTRNRHAVLDVTLRSLSASNLPDDQKLIIFDDGSDLKATKDYLYTNRLVSTVLRLPHKNQHWDKWLGKLPVRKRAHGIDGKIEVVRLGDASKGVVRASCAAFRWMLEKYGPEHGIVMVQDDVVFTEQWLERLHAAKQKPEPDGRPVGLIAGCWINKKNSTKREPMTLVPNGGITAQCYYITPAGIRAVLPWTRKNHTISKGFDNKFCAHVRSKADVYRMHPAVCQHIGLESLVRPRWKWNKWNAKGRIDYSAKKPYPLAEDVRSFEA
jgi:hypothetical protein